MEPQTPSKRRRTVIIAIGVFLVALIAAELGARSIRLTPDPWASVQNLWQEVGIPELTKILEPDPELFWRVRPHLDEVEVTGYVTTEFVTFHVSTDEHGFRITPDTTQDQGAPVILLGDSTTFGLGLEAPETYAGRLDEMLEDAGVLNGAIPSGTAYQARRLLEGSGLEPACVVGCFGTAAGDASWLENLGDPEFAAFEQSRRQWADTSGLVFFALHDLPMHRRRTGLRTRRLRLDPKELIDEVMGIADWCREQEVPFILMSWIQKQQRVHVDYQLYVAELAESEEIPLLDVFELLKDREPDRLFIDSIHLDAEGHALVAEGLAPLVKEVLKAK